MDTDMNCNPTIEESSPERLELSYETDQEKALWVGMAANHQETTRPPNIHNEAPPTHTPTRMMSLTSNSHMTLRPLPNQNYGVVLSIPFLFMVSSNTLLQTSRISKLPSISWPNTFKTNKLMVVRVMTSTISTVWKMPSETSSRQSMWLDGTHCTLTKKLTHSGQKYLQSLPRDLSRPMATTRKNYQNQSQSQSTKLHLSLLCQLNPRRRSMSSPSISNKRSLW